MNLGETKSLFLLSRHNNNAFIMLSRYILSVGPEQMQFQNWNIYFANHRHYLEEIKDDED